MVVLNVKRHLLCDVRPWCWIWIVARGEGRSRDGKERGGREQYRGKRAHQ